MHGKLEPEESVLSTDIIDDDLYNGGNVYPVSSSTTKLLGDISKALYNLGWDVDDEFKVDIGGVKVWNRLSSEGALVGTQNVRTSDSSSSIISTLNNLIPDTGSGVSIIPINISSESSGLLSLEQFSITYIMRTVNLDIEFDEQEVLHPRVEPYEVVTRHIIGEQASQMNRAKLTLLTDVGSNPVLEWENGDIIIVTLKSIYKTMNIIGFDNVHELERSRKLNNLMTMLIMWLREHPDWPYNKKGFRRF